MLPKKPKPLKPDHSHMIDHDAEALMRGERVDATNAQRSPAEPHMLHRDASVDFRKTDELGRSFRIEGVIDAGRLMTSQEFMDALKAMRMDRKA